MVIPDDAYSTQATVKKLGDFRRRGTDGPPIVPSVTKTRKRKGKKADLLAVAKEMGYDDDPDEYTVPELHKLLGPEPADDLYGRPSGFGDPLENSYALRKWIERGIAHGVVQMILDGFDPSTVDLDDIAALDRLVNKAQAAVDAMIWADRGTFVHRLVERHETGRSVKDLIPEGEALGIPEALQRAILKAWEQFRQRLGMTALHCELAVVNDDCRIAGTMDLLDQAGRRFDTEFGPVEVGDAVIADIKTGDLRDKYAVQIAGYQGGVPYDVDTERRGTWPVQPVAHVGLVYHMSMKAVLDGAPPRWEAIPVDLVAGRDGARICCEARDWPATSVFGSAIEIAAPSAPADVEQPVTGSESRTSDPVTLSRRDQLRDRMLRMRSNANDTGWGDTFAAEWAAHNIGPESTDDEVQEALDAIEPPFDVVTEPAPARTVALVDEPAINNGGRIDQVTLNELMGTIKLSPGRDVVNRWLIEADGSWDPRTHRTVRHFEIARAAHALTSRGCDDEYARLLIGVAIDSELGPTTPVGIILSSLSIDEARRTTNIAEAFGNRLTLQFSDDGQPFLVGDVAAVLAAA